MYGDKSGVYCVSKTKVGYDGFVFVDELGERMRANYLTSVFPKFLESHGLRRMRFHDLRHLYVKHTTKKYNSEKQKTQATKIDLIAWVFRFCMRPCTERHYREHYRIWRL